jgi:hypothetical protein
MLFREPLLQFRNKIGERYAEPVADHLQLDHIDAAFAALDLADGWLLEGKPPS